MKLARAVDLDIIHAHYAIPHAAAAYLARQVLAGTSIFGTVQLAPMLMLEREPKEGDTGLRPIKTVPSHFSAASTAGALPLSWMRYSPPASTTVRAVS